MGVSVRESFEWLRYCSFNIRGFRNEIYNLTSEELNSLQDFLRIEIDIILKNCNMTQGCAYLFLKHNEYSLNFAKAVVDFFRRSSVIKVKWVFQGTAEDRIGPNYYTITLLWDER